MTEKLPVSKGGAMSDKLSVKKLCQNRFVEKALCNSVLDFDLKPQLRA